MVFCYFVGMMIGNLNIKGKVLCAPMAGISNPPYRILARRFGAAVVYTEMVSSHGLAYGGEKTEKLLDFGSQEQPIGIQLFGADPDIMYRAAQIVSKRNPAIIDLNFGCPTKKVVKKNGGAAVLKDLGLTRSLVEAAVAGSNFPVTVKLRSGWDETTKVYIEAGRVCEQAGASAITLHARTKSKQFSGHACWDDIERLKRSVSIPVIGNGDVCSGPDAQRMLDSTGCDAVMVGRAAMGNPWIFRDINHYLMHKEVLPPPDLKEKTEIILEHAQILALGIGEDRAVLQMRKHVAWYVKGMIGSSEIRRRVNKTESFSELGNLLSDIASGKTSKFHD
ncbi:MAG: tRNA dihydrouridine synthase DusB [candidate division Zixibacteria bacterium]